MIKEGQGFFFDVSSDVTATAANLFLSLSLYLSLSSKCLKQK